MLADITLSTEAAVAIGVMFGALSGAVAWGVKGWIGSLTADRDSWQNIALSNTDDLERVANKLRRSKGQAPIKTLAAVIPESNSPPTEKQIQTANISTVRARQAMLRVDLDLPAQQEGNGTSLVAEIADNMKDKVDESAEDIKDKVDESANEIKDKIDDIK